MCNLFNNGTTQELMRRLFDGLNDRLGNHEPRRVYPDQSAAILRQDGDGLELVRARWGLPSPPSVLKTSRDPGVTNIRNLSSSHWRRWLGPEHRCLVPLTSFAEPLGNGMGNQWFAAMDSNTTMFFAGIELRGWNSVRKVKDGETEDDLFAFLTYPPNAEVKSIHPKAMPVILTTQEEWSEWKSTPAEKLPELQRALPDGTLQLVDEPL